MDPGITSRDTPILESTEDEFQNEEMNIQTQQKLLRTYKRTKANDTGSEFILPKKTAKQLMNGPTATAVSTQNYYTPLTTISTGTTVTPSTSTVTANTKVTTTKISKEPNPQP